MWQERSILPSQGENMVEEKDIRYLAVRYIECLCIAVFIFGFLWNGTEVMKLTMPQFLMLYGGGGAVISEVLARLFSKKKLKK